MSVLPQKRAETVALFGLMLSVAMLICMMLISSTCNSTSAKAISFQLIATILIWGISLLHLRARRLAVEESQAIEEAEKMRAEQGRQRLFDGAVEESAPAQIRLREMERYGAPLVSAIIVLVQGVFGIWLIYALATLTSAPEVGADLGIDALAELSSTIFGGTLALFIAFMAFGLGKYASGMSRVAHASLLRAGAGHMILIAVFSLLLAIANGFGYMGNLQIERILSWIIPAVMILLSLEMSINFILDYYRPRTPGVEARPIYDGRLTGILAEKEGLVKTFAHTLDYQFGFKVSETWFFQFMNRAIAPLIFFQLGTLYLMSCLVIVKPGNVAVIERWGRPRGETVTGYHRCRCLEKTKPPSSARTPL
jgi:hypothetical protein